MEIDRIQADTNNGNSVFLRAYLEGFIVNEADRRQVDRIIAESNATKNLRCHFKNDVSLRKAGASYDELTRLFNVLEGFVLVPIELENTKELAEEHLTVRIRSIEMLEEVLELVAVKGEAFS